MEDFKKDLDESVSHLRAKVAAPSGCSSCAFTDAFKGITAKELFTWVRPVATGIVVGSILALVIIFGYFEYTIVTFLCRLAQLLMVALGALIFMKRLTLTADDVRSITTNTLQKTQPVVTAAVDGVFRVVAWENTAVSTAVLVGSVVLGLLGNCVADDTLIVLITIAAFGGTPLYFANKAAIDPHVDTVVKKAKELIKQLPIGKQKTQ